MYCKFFYTVSALFLLFLTSCNNSNKEFIKLVEERDSLRQLNKMQSSKLNDYGQAVELLSTTLDSIALQENMIFTSDGDMPVTKQDMKYNLMRFEALLKRQKEKIGNLEAQIRENSDSTDQSLRLIAYLKEQINLKNAQIAQLSAELERKNVDISQLRQQVGSQSATINELNQRTRKQGEVLARQDAILNNGYVLIGSKTDLKRKGVITKKGQLVSNAILDRTKFAKVDIRNWTEISFQARKPQILTNMPTWSFELTTSGDRNFTLHIKNPSDFWRISNYLVIQTD